MSCCVIGWSRCLVVLLGGPDVFLYWTGDGYIYFIHVALLVRIFLLLMNAVALECSSGKESGCWKGAEERGEGIGKRFGPEGMGAGGHHWFITAMVPCFPSSKLVS